jgi:hypothetical protein
VNTNCLGEAPQKRHLVHRDATGTRKKLDADKLKAETIKASVHAKVEHPFRRIKQ